MPRAADTPAGLLAALATSDPTRPRLTWYDDAPGPTQGERIELSGRVLATWVAKAANLLQDELDVGPGSVVAVDLPAHWRAAYWLFATWSVGAHAVSGCCLAGQPHDVVVTDDPEGWPTGQVVAVSLPALAQAWSGAALASGVIDEARELATYPDVFTAADQPVDDDLAFTTPAQVWSYGGLVAQARELAAGLARPARVMTSAGPAGAVAAWLAPWTADGSVVLVNPNDHDAAGPGARADHLAAVERVTDRR